MVRLPGSSRLETRPTAKSPEDGKGSVMRVILRTLLMVMAAGALSASLYGIGEGNRNDGNHNKGNHDDDMDVCDDHRDTATVQRSEAAKRFAGDDDDNNKGHRPKHHEPGECPESPDR
jgi:hypothetical protein